MTSKYRVVNGARWEVRRVFPIVDDIRWEEHVSRPVPFQPFGIEPLTCVRAYDGDWLLGGVQVDPLDPDLLSAVVGGGGQREVFGRGKEAGEFIMAANGLGMDAADYRRAGPLGYGSATAIEKALRFGHYAERDSERPPDSPPAPRPASEPEGQLEVPSASDDVALVGGSSSADDVVESGAVTDGVDGDLDSGGEAEGAVHDPDSARRRFQLRVIEHEPDEGCEGCPFQREIAADDCPGHVLWWFCGGTDQEFDMSTERAPDRCPLRADAVLVRRKGSA